MNLDILKTALIDLDFKAIDFIFAEFILRRNGGEGSNVLYTLCAMLSRNVRLGDSCIALNEERGRWIDGVVDGVELPTLSELLALDCSSVLEQQPDAKKISAKPLVLDSAGRLYLQRYFYFELIVAERVLARVGGRLEFPKLAKGQLGELLPFFAKTQERAECDFQQLAVVAALSHRLVVLSGGPGTGKTTVVSSMLALELERNENLQIYLCAPTGKAQARMQESILEGVKYLNISDEIKQKLTEIPCSTIHSMVGISMGGKGSRYNQKSPLPADLVVVDESSMVSLPLMTTLLLALDDRTRLVLLGDKDQLASVEIGSVMEHLCRCGCANNFAKEFADDFKDLTSWNIGEAQGLIPLIELTENHRFSSAPNIGEISLAIRNLEETKDFSNLASIIGGLDSEDFKTFDYKEPDFEEPLRKFLSKKTADGLCFLDIKDLARKGGKDNLKVAFNLLNSYKILVASNRGACSVESLNELVRKILHIKEFYAVGVPILIKINSPELGLYNGDIGLVWKSEDDSEPLVYFPNLAKGILITDLPTHETVYAMTIHKSQGSGFTNVLMVLPPKTTKLLTRELLYTGITRAAKYVEIWGSNEVLAQGLADKTIRYSGLESRLKGEL